MAVLDLIASPWVLLAAFVVYLGSYYLVPYFVTYRHISDIPGPFLAKFSNIWLASAAQKGRKFAAVDAAHRKYGKVVRVGYNHVSIADEKGLPLVYGHGNGFLKDHFYETFVSGVAGVFSTRDRVDHTRKRKIIAHAFSPKAVGAFEVHMASNIRRWIKQLDRICAYPTKDGYGKVNIMPWCSYLAFDIIGDLAFGKPFGMIEKGRDEAEVQMTPGGPITYAPAVEILNRRGEVSSTLGLLLPLKRVAKYLPTPFFMKGTKSVAQLHGMAVAAVADRLDALEHDSEKGKGNYQASDRLDILQRLIQAKDGDGRPMGRDEITSEALTQLIAGSDTISNTTCAIIYWILHGERANPGSILPHLHAELDASIPEDQSIAESTRVLHLPYLRRCINEAMRLHSTSAIGLPRIIPQGTTATITFDSHVFTPGTVLSVPSYTIHHLSSIWGPDVEDFNPDRWLPENLTEQQKLTFNPFSYGPRACVGRNVAELELAIIIASFFRRYDVALYQEKLESHEGFSKKPEACWVGLKRRGGYLS